MRLRVLTYHRVAEADATPHLNPRMISATPATFETQMRFLARNYCAVSMAEVLAAVQRSARLPRRAVLITFDDAYRDFAEQAWPVLQALRLPVTLFVPTGYPGHPGRSFWWDRLYRACQQIRQAKIEVPPLGMLACANAAERRHSLKRMQDFVKTLPHAEAMLWVENFCAPWDNGAASLAAVLSWKELRQLAQQGVTLGAHTVTHPMMTRLSPEEIQREIVQSLEDLRRETGAAPPVFCYPSGGHDDTVVDILRAQGILAAFTTLDGQNDLRSDEALRLRRTNITPRTTPLLFRLRLTKLASHVDAWRHRGK